MYHGKKRRSKPLYIILRHFTNVGNWMFSMETLKNPYIISLYDCFWTHVLQATFGRDKIRNFSGNKCYRLLTFVEGTGYLSFFHLF